MAVSFYIDKRTDKNGDAPIRVSIAIRGARLLTSTGQKTQPTKWNKDKQRVKQGASNAAGQTYNVINGVLAKIEDLFNQYEGQCVANDIYPTTEDIKKMFAENFSRKRQKVEAKKSQSFYDILNLFTDDVGKANQWTKGTFSKFAALRNHLLDFNRDLDFADLTEDRLNDFVAFLRDEKEMRNSTIAKQLNFIKWFMRWATAKGYNTNMAFQTYSPHLKQSKKKVIYLEWDELMRVFNYDVPSDGTAVALKDANGNEYVKTVHASASTAVTRDIFCFCCFTSLRYSDAANLKRTDIHGDVMTITTIKTADTLTIELNKYARAVLDRYKDRTDLDGYVFPHITNQRMNIYLKDLCELCEINQPITQTYYRGSERIEVTEPKYELIGTHCGRRTFICHALSIGIPADIVMKWTGHSDYNSMKPYIDIINKAKAKAMSLFNEL